MAVNIRDPIHGFIMFNDLEGELIQSYPFQRLRFIHQLGTSNWVYPGGVHTRFEHSLGVFHLAASIIDRLKIPEIDDNEKEIFRVASLLHDIGHAPFSHVGENAELFESGFDHEIMGSKIIQESRIGDIIRKNLPKDSLERISFIVTGGKSGRPSSHNDVVFSTLLTGQAGIDRMDYLLRDSHFLGVAYGRFDLARMLETVRYTSDLDLFWEEGGIHVLEQFILARYFMFKDVYFHKTRRVLDFHLGTMMKAFLRQVKKRDYFPTEVGEYVQINDIDLISYILSNDKLSRVFMGRQFHRLIDRESSDHPNQAELVVWDNIEKEIVKFLEKDDFYFDNAENAPYKFEKANEIRVEYQQAIRPLTIASDLVRTLQRIRKKRIYVVQGKKVQTRQFVDTFLKAGKP